MEKNIRKVSKVRISTYQDSAVKRGRAHRFARWCSKMYGISWRGVYENLRRTHASAWKWEGISSCLKEFCPEHEGTAAQLWQQCTRNRLADFMATKGMSRMTVWKRFGADDWKPLELQGIRTAYRWWSENVGRNGE